MAGGDAVRLSLRPGACAGHARCNEVDGRLFPLDDEGYSALTTTSVHPDDVTLARAGADACPERAIVIEG
jgi:ferredoxin